MQTFLPYILSRSLAHLKWKILFMFFFFSVFFPRHLFAAANIEIPTLSVPFLSDILTKPDAGGRITWITDYASALYRFGFLICGLVAVFFLIAGGIQWTLSAGDSGRVEQAKEYISGSIMGMVILFSSYLILYTINPGLVTFAGLRIQGPPPPEKVEAKGCCALIHPHLAGTTYKCDANTYSNNCEYVAKTEGWRNWYFIPVGSEKSICVDKKTNQRSESFYVLSSQGDVTYTCESVK